MAFPVGDKLVWNQVNYERFTRGKTGPIGRDLARRGILIEAAAKNFASGNNGGPRVRTNRLRSSISWALGEDEISMFVDVGTNVEYGGYVELGTRRAKAYPYLRPALPAGGINR